jgi:hypothetical protein
MNSTDKQQFFDLFAATCRAFDKKLDAAMAAEFFGALTDYPLANVEQAKLFLVQHSKFWPKIRDWRQACDAVRAAVPTPATPMARQLENGDVERVYCCITCEDGGWRPACGCRFGEMNYLGECSRHPRTANQGKAYRQAMMACMWRDANPVFQANRPKVTGGMRDAGQREA